MGEKNVNWSLIAKKAWETRRKNAGKQGKAKKAVKSEKLTEEEKFMWRVFEAEKFDYLDWADKNERAMVRKMRRKALMERALGVYDNQAIYFGNGEELEKRKIERGSWGVKIGN